MKILMSRTIRYFLAFVLFTFILMQYYTLKVCPSCSIAYQTFGTSLFSEGELNRLTMAGGKFSLIMGIIGVFLLVSMMIYSLRKRIKRLSNKGELSHWLSFHMFCGVAGQLFILLHSNLNFRGLAGTAFLFMVISFISGIVGRYLFFALSKKLSDFEDSFQSVKNELHDFTELTLNILERVTFYKISELAGNSVFQYRLRYYPRFYFNSIKIRISCFISKSIPIDERVELINYLRFRKRLFYFSTLKSFFSYWHIFHIQFSVLFCLFTLIHIISSLYFSVDN